MRTKSFYTAVFVMVALCLIQTLAQGDDTRPGEKNPVNMTRPALFQDDEVLVLTGYAYADDKKDPRKIYYDYLYPTHNDLTNYDWHRDNYQFSNTEFGDISYFRHMAAASGRLLYPDKRDTAVYAFFRPDGNVQVELWDAKSGRQTHYVTLDGTQDKHRSVDVAVGDLDGVVDDNGMYHGEIVVVRTCAVPGGGGMDFALDVLDKDLKVIASDKFQWPAHAVIVAVGIGDFNGDGFPEIAAGIASDVDHVRQAYIYRFARDEKGSLISPLKFERSESAGQQVACCYNQAFDMTVGDFDGDGKDEIYFVSVVYDSQDHVYLDHAIFRADKDLKLSLAWSSVWNTGWSQNIKDGSLRTQSGLFYFDPANGWTLNRRQVVGCLIWTGGIYVFNIRFDSDEFGNLTPHYDDWRINSGPDWHFEHLDLAVGNYVGHGVDGKATSPLMNPVIAYTRYNDHTLTCNSSGAMVIDWYKGFAARKIFEFGGPDCVSVKNPFMPVAVTAIDGDGNTYRLGPPVHITIENLIGLDYVIQEPPKHVDFLPLDPDKPNSDWGVINVSAKSDFNVEFMESEGESFSLTSQKTSNWSIGGSAELDVKATVSAGFGDIAKVSLSGESDTKIGYNYESSESHYNSKYEANTYDFTSVTETDDFISGKIQMMDIWRFPIIGYDTGDPNKPHAFQEIILPNNKNDQNFGGGGLNKADWYQPVHQNHNLLSYPVTRQDKPFPPDLGTFTLPGGTVKNTTMNDSATIRYFDGNSIQIKMLWTTEAGSGSDKHYNHTLSESEDIKIGASAEGTYLDGDVQVEASFSVGFHNENSWGGSTTEEAKSSNSTGITINVPSGDRGKAYAFQSAVYVSSGGGKLKVAHAVDPTGSSSGRGWWRRQYGNKPDPALNLPNRFNSDGEDWTLNTGDDRKEMRGFFMRKFNSRTGKYDLLGAPPHAGDTVQLCARVYNFSLCEETVNVDVSFEYVQVDGGGGKEIGDRFPIGTVSRSLGGYPDLAAGGPPMKEVCVDWDTNGVRPGGYRFYVTVDPNDEVKNEIHEWKDASGNRLAHGNNEGYWPWAGNAVQVLEKQSQSIQVVNVQQAQTPGVSMHIESLAVEKPSGLKSKGPVRVFAHEKYRLRAHIVANEDHPHHHYTIFYDGPPENGKAIAVKTNFGVIDGDNYVWTNWTPQETGIREIYVHFIEDLDDENRGDAWDSLKVIVREEPISWRDEVIDRLMGVEE